MSIKGAIRIECQGAETIDFKLICWFQGDLKQLTEDAFKALKESILVNGFSEPISVWQIDGITYAVNGHQRLLTLEKMIGEGYTIGPVPINYVFAKSMKEAKLKVMALAGGYGRMTAESVAAYAKENDIAPDEFKAFFQAPEVTLSDVIVRLDPTTPAPPPEPEENNFDTIGPCQVVLGDVFELGGRHKLVCGDSLNLELVEEMMGETQADLAYMDPPYGMSVVKQDGQNNGLGNAKNGVVGVAARGRYAPIEGDDTTQTAIDAVGLCIGLAIKHLVFWGANFYAEALPPSSGWICWDKDNGEGFFADGELAWTNDKKQLRIFRHQWKGMIKASERGEKRQHPTQKPVALAEWVFEHYAPQSKVVLDLFGGSGSTLIACEKTGRKCFMMELSPAYVQSILNRWAAFTGQDPIRVSDGLAWSAIKGSN